MLCIKCKKEIPAESLFCMYCGKKQTVTKAKYHKREHGSGSITRDKRNKNQWIAHAPANKEGRNRVYIGAFATRAEAQAAIDDYMKRGCPDLPNATVKDIYEMWNKTHFKEISDSAVNTYNVFWKRFSEIEDMPIKDVRTAHFQKIIDDAPSYDSAKKIRTICSKISQYAMENDITLKNYADFIKLPKREKKEKRVFSAEEIKLLWQHSDDRNIQVILLMIYTGFRVGELLAIKKRDIHLEEGYIIGGEKTEAGRNRIVPLPPNIPELREYIITRMQTAAGERIFPESYTNFCNNVFYKGLADIGLGDKSDENHLTPHSTRHTFASLSAAAGMHPENLQKIIGHANYSTTAEIYIHQDIETLKTEMSKLTR